MTDLRPRGSRRTPAVARHGRLRRSHPFQTIAKFLLSMAAVALVSGTSVAAFAAWDLQASLKPSVHLVGQSPHPGPAGPQLVPLSGAFNVLITATDTRTGQGDGWGSLDDSSGKGLNDATMLLHVAADHTSATVVSFPRDLMIPIPSCPDGKGGWYSAMSKQMLNTTLQYGGLACTVLTVSHLIDEQGFSIPYAGVVEFNGVVAMSNAIGGVQVCVANGIHDPLADLDLDPGMHTLKGREAAEFLRTRHGLVGGGDLSRISNQQVFLSALVRQVRQASTLSDPTKVWGLAKAVAGNVRLSESLNNLTTMAQMALAVKNLDLDKVLFVQYPVLTDPDNTNRVIPDYDSAKVLFDAIVSDQPLTFSGSTGDGAVVATPTPDPTAPAATGTPTGQATDPAAPGAGVLLPENIHGQAASTKTCSNGQG